MVYYVGVWCSNCLCSLQVLQSSLLLRIGIFPKFYVIPHWVPGSPQITAEDSQLPHVWPPNGCFVALLGWTPAKTSSTWRRFISHDSNRVKVFSFAWIIIIRSGNKLVHVMTDELAWHMQFYNWIESLKSNLGQNMFLEIWIWGS